MKIKKVDDPAKAQPVDDVADRAADDQADRVGENIAAHPRQPEHQDRDDRHGGDREQRHAQPLTGIEQAKAHPAIAGQHKVEKRGHPLVAIDASDLAEMFEQHMLAQLIDDDDRDCRSDAAPDRQATPANWSPREPTTAAQRRHRSSCPATWPTSGSTRQQRSHLSPGASRTTAPMPGRSGRVKASAGGAPTVTVPDEVMHNSARSTSRSSAAISAGT